jgi:copper(I)-binding protein
MLIGMKQDLNVGESYTLELQFEKSGTISVEPEVRQP